MEGAIDRLPTSDVTTAVDLSIDCGVSLFTRRGHPSSLLVGEVQDSNEWYLDLDLPGAVGSSVTDARGDDFGGALVFEPSSDPKNDAPKGEGSLPFVETEAADSLAIVVDGCFDELLNHDEKAFDGFGVASSFLECDTRFDNACLVVVDPLDVTVRLLAETLLTVGVSSFVAV